MRAAQVAKVAGLVAAALVVGFFTVEGSYALWNRLVPAGAGTVQSADFIITLTSSHNSGTYQMVLADGTPATVAIDSVAAPLAKLFPGAPVYAAVSVKNATAAGSAFTVWATVGPPVVSGSGPSGGLSQYLSLQSAVAPSLNQCSSLPAAAYQSTFPGVQITKGGSAIICFRVLLAPTAPSALQGESASIAVPLHVEQIP